MKINPTNERLKRQYFDFIKDAHRKQDSTINNIRKAIARYEEFTGYKDFGTFNKKTALAFKKHLTNTNALKSGKPLSLPTLNSTLNCLKAFLQWLSCQNGYKARINRLEIDYLNLSENEVRSAKSSGFSPYPSFEQIRKVLEVMPNNTEIEKRDRAVIAFLALTAARDGAICSARLKHMDLEHELFKQDPRTGVKSKTGKRIDTFFFPVGDDIKAIVVEWVKYLREVKLWDAEAPLFPRTQLAQDEHYSFKAGGLEPINWASATQLRQIVRQAFEAAGLPYYIPHSFRKTLTALGERLCRTPEEFKAWSQNLGHESPLTTFNSYGYVDVNRQGDIIKGISAKKPQGKEDVKVLLQRALEEME